MDGTLAAAQVDASGRLGAAFTRALDNLGPDLRLAEESAAELLRTIAAATSIERAAIAFDPEKYLGPFEDLPAPAQAAILAAIADRERSEVRGYELGGWYWATLRVLWRIRHRAYAGKRAVGLLRRHLRETADVLAYGARKAPAFAIASLHRGRTSLRARLLPRPAVTDVLSRAGIDAREFANCYARQVPQDERYRGYWHDASRKITVGRVLGIDLLASDDGMWFVESNTNPELEYKRTALYERDPLIVNLFEFAEQHGYRRLMVLNNRSSGVEPEMERQYVEEAHTRDMQLTMPTLPNVPGPADVRSYGIPPVTSDATLVVRIRPHPNSLDHLLGKKRASYRALGLYREAVSDPALKLPTTGPEPLLTDTDPDQPFPNVVYKLPEVDQGRGVYFLKAGSIEHARELLREALEAPRSRALEERILHTFTNKHGLYQAYVKSRLLDDRRLYKIRAFILVSPVGVRFLSAHRVVAAHPVPERLAPGVVTDTRPFLINTARGGRYSLVPQDELEDTAAAAEAVARGFAWAAAYGFRTS